jgi:ribose/xylose/arabinose/galactoside ABC-type transport system permease subunit
MIAALDYKSFWIEKNKSTLYAFSLFLLFFVTYVCLHPAGFKSSVVLTIANKSALLAFVAMAQSLVVITGGIDLSAGMILVLCNCIASTYVLGTPAETGLGLLLVLLAGTACGVVNGLIVVYGRLQPIVTTIATGAAFYGLALLLRPVPGGSVNEMLADLFTSSVLGLFRASILALLATIAIVWLPFSRSILGRTAYAAGSAENAAHMSGLPVKRAKLAAYALAGFLSGLGGLYLTFFSYTGEATLASGNAYTLYSIAAVVLGGISLAGGRGSLIGAVFGAFAFRAIGDLLFVFDMDPLWQPLFQGFILVAAVAIGSLGFLRVRNKLDRL